MNSLALNLSIQGWWHSWSWQVLMRHWGKVICWVLLSLICPENLLVIPLCSLKAIKRSKKQAENSFTFSHLLQKPQKTHFKSAVSYLNVTEFNLTVGITLFWAGKLRQEQGDVFPWTSGVNPGLESGSSLLWLAQSWRNTTAGRFIAHFILLPPYP